jgi:hypothetical protein
MKRREFITAARRRGGGMAAQYELVINLKTAKALGLDEFLYCDSAKMKTTGTSIPAVVVQIPSCGAASTDLWLS